MNLTGHFGPTNVQPSTPDVFETQKSSYHAVQHATTQLSPAAQSWESTVPDWLPSLPPVELPQSTPGLSSHAGHSPIRSVALHGQPFVCIEIDGCQRLCLAQISSTLLRTFSYNEIHNRRVALGITCVQCSPSQLELLRQTGAMPGSSRRCGTITLREAQRLIKSFLDQPDYPRLPDNFEFRVKHGCGWGCCGSFVPARYTSSRAKCIRCCDCSNYYSPNKFIFHSHDPPAIKSKTEPTPQYRHPDAANFNAWRRHLYLAEPNSSEQLLHSWEDVKAMFNGGSRGRRGPSCRPTDFTTGKSLNNGLKINPTMNQPWNSSSNQTPGIDWSINKVLGCSGSMMSSSDSSSIVSFRVDDEINIPRANLRTTPNEIQSCNRDARTSDEARFQYSPWKISLTSTNIQAQASYTATYSSGQWDRSEADPLMKGDDDVLDLSITNRRGLV